MVYKYKKEEAKKYRQSEKGKAAIKRYQQSDVGKANIKRYRENNKEKIRLIHEKWRKNNKKVVMDHYGNKCSCCDETELKFLTIDHINDDGAKHRRKIGRKLTGQDFYRWIIVNKFPKNLQILCFNCNCGRASNDGVCPHKDKT